MGEKRKPHVYIDPRYVTEDTPDLFEERDDLIAKLRADLAQARKALAEARAERDALADDEQASAEALADERAKREAAKAQIAQLDAQLSAAHARMMELNRENIHMGAERDALKVKLAAIRAWTTEERPAIPKCLDPGHDDRWCSHCDSMMDGVGHAQATVLRILDGDVNL